MDPAGPAARTVDTLHWVMFAGLCAITALVLGLLALAFRKRERGSSSARPWIIGGGLVFPGVVLAGLLAYALWLGEELQPHDRVPPVRVEAESSQYLWTFRHPGPGDAVIVSRDTLHIPAGRPVDVVLTSRDVVHSFWVPRLAGKMDAIPGHENVLRIEANVPGIYPGICAEYCGIGHSRHGFRVIAHDPASWAGFQQGGEG